MICTYRDIEYEIFNHNDYTLQKYLGSAKDRITDLLKSGIYEIGCQDGCAYAYYGMSERKPTFRFYGSATNQYCETSYSTTDFYYKNIGVYQ